MGFSSQMALSSYSFIFSRMEPNGTKWKQMPQTEIEIIFFSIENVMEKKSISQIKSLQILTLNGSHDVEDVI